MEKQAMLAPLRVKGQDTNWTGALLPARVNSAQYNLQ